MFYGQMADARDSIELPDCEYEGLLELFRFIYSDEVELTGRKCHTRVLRGEEILGTFTR